MWKVPPGPLVFHVLAWKATEGTAATVAVKPRRSMALARALSRFRRRSCLKSVACRRRPLTLCPLPGSTTRPTRLLLATDDGKIYRISCVFACALNTQPMVDWVFTLPVAGTGGAAAKPNGPVYDFPSGRLFVGDQLGELWVINASGASPTLNAGPVMIGGGGCTTTNPPGRTGTPVPCTASGGSFGIPDSVIMDSSGSQPANFCVLRQRWDRRRQCGRGTAQDGPHGTGAVTCRSWQCGQRDHQLWIFTPAAFDNKYLAPLPTPAISSYAGRARHYESLPLLDRIQRLSSHGFAPSDGFHSPAVPTAHGLACSPYSEMYNPNITLGRQRAITISRSAV